MLCDSCDKNIDLESPFYGFDKHNIPNYVCKTCAKKYKWLYLEDLDSGDVIIDSSWPIYWTEGE